jgi:hypothetical protein
MGCGICEGTTPLTTAKSKNISVWLFNQTTSNLITWEPPYFGTSWSETLAPGTVIPAGGKSKVGVLAKTSPDTTTNYGWLYFVFEDSGRVIQLYVWEESEINSTDPEFPYEQDWYLGSSGLYSKGSSEKTPQPNGEIGCCEMDGAQDLITFKTGF